MLLTESFDKPMASAMSLIVNRLFESAKSLILLTFSSVVDVDGLPERSSFSTFYTIQRFLFLINKQANDIILFFKCQ